MSSLTNINNNASVVNVGRTTPVNPGQQPAEKSIPVVIASDQEPVPVVEQNKVLSEVALSLLGIPRSEVALGIFADVNTYDVNPTEWSAEPNEYTVSNSDGWGIKHLPEEAGALIEAPKDKVAVLTSKRFFRYQPGRVSAATFGVKSTTSPSPNLELAQYDLNPSIRKYGIFDKYDGYYWETRGDSTGDNFSVVRRTQSLLRNNPLPYPTGQLADHALSGKAPSVYKEEPNVLPTVTKFLIDNRFKIIELAFAAVSTNPAITALSATQIAKCKRDMDLAMEAYILDLQYGGNAHSIVNATTYRMALLENTATAENVIHTSLRTILVSQLTDPVSGLGAEGTTAAAKVYTNGAPSELARWTLNAIAGTQPTAQNILEANYGSRSAITTIFSIYSKFYGYLASEYSYNPATGVAVPSTEYTIGSSTLSREEIKYRCFRDVTYVMEGYGEDLEGGGDASTIYNARRYYFNGLQNVLYSQGVLTVTGEVNRHTFVKDLMTRSTAMTIGTKTNIVSMATLFPNIFVENDVLKLVTRLNNLANIIIQNFTNENTGAIEYGSGANYGDLAVLRDGLIMTHAAVFDPSLLKKTKNVVIKPNFIISKTTTGAAANATALTLNDVTGVSIGQSVNVPGSTIPNFVVGISGNIINLRNAVGVVVANGATVSFGDSTVESSQDEFVVGQYINFYGTAAGLNANGLTANRLYKVEKVRGPKGNVLVLSDATSTNNKFNGTITIVGGNPVLTVTSTGSFDLGPGVRIEGKGLADGTYITAAGGSATQWVLSATPPAMALLVNPVTSLSLEVTRVAVVTPDISPTNPTFIYINPNVPFVFPKEYFVGKTDNNPSNAINPFTKPDGLFPLLYTRSGVLPGTEDDDEDKVGYIDTSIVESGSNVLKSQIDIVNLTYNNWIKQNVDPRYYSVYEFRIPRSRFSTDQLNGESNKTVFSDVATGEAGVSGGKVYPGSTVTRDGVQLITNSVWDIDFTKVTMLKVEFSWYGAVGALFLAYVPVGNGEARWVRVHHLRASNQLKISSLGNATLPITYLVYGGGSVSRLGIADAINKGYSGSTSNHIVKYGASYYIDGGDRGTVRLYSHSTMNSTDVFGSRYALPALAGGNFTSDALGYYIDVSSVTSQQVPGWPSDMRYFMKAKVLTGSRADQNIEVIWVVDSGGTKKLYLSKGPLNSTSSVSLIANRPSIVFGLKAKQNILNAVGTGIRNRVQVYPTKLSTSSTAPVGVNTTPKVKLQLLKTPIYQPATAVSGSFTLSAEYEVTPANLPLTNVSSGYLSTDGDGLYGWFRANVGTVFGYLYRQSGSYYFNLLETYSDPVKLYNGNVFLPDGRFDFSGNSLNGVTEDTIQKERLSSVFVSTQTQAPIPKTGIEVASFFLQQGSDLFDLLNYFDYNKDYLSFPLTDKVESVYLAASSVQNATATNGTATPVAEISSSLTWEEQ